MTNLLQASRMRARVRSLAALPIALLMIAGMLMVVMAQSAAAETSGPGWSIGVRAEPTNFSAPPRFGVPDGYQVTVTNSGSVATNGGPVTIVDTLPSDVTATNVEGIVYGPEFSEGLDGTKNTALPCVSAASTVRCTDSEPVPPGGELEMKIEVEVSTALQEGEQVQDVAEVLGGGAASATSSLSTPISSAPAGFGIEHFSAVSTDLAGAPDTQAGGHPYENTVTFNFNTAPQFTYISPSIHAPISHEVTAAENVKDTVVDLPPGFVGNPQVVQKCPQTIAIQDECPLSTQIGVARIVLSPRPHVLGADEVNPIYNVVPDAGYPAQFQFNVGPVPVTLHASVSQDTNYAVRVTTAGVPYGAGVGSLKRVEATFFGEPLTDPDVLNKSVGANPVAFLQSPVNCAAGPLTATTTADSWENPGSYLPDGQPNLSDPAWKTATATMYPALTGCEALQFDPALTVTPDTTQADEPTGVTVHLHVPQTPDLFPDAATPEIKDATVTLPAGMSLSPSAADGLEGCSDAQVALESTEPASCPNASVLGTAKVLTPLLPDPLEGQVYLGTPGCDPCTNADAADGNMLRIFLVVYGDGVRIKKEGKIYANPSSGQITTRFTENPQLPFEDLELHFKGGLRAGLATPQACGTATTTTDFVPWSSPITPDANPISFFDVDSNGEGGACPSTPPLHPSFSAGTSNPNAGQFSPLTMTFGREDREQDLSGIQVRTPPGLSGVLTGVPLCGEPQAAQGTCPEASRIGTMTVSAGPGSHPFYTKGSLYLTQSYKGAPFGLSIVVPTVAGPFNLGNVVVRAQVDVDRNTAALTVTSDPFPQVIAGIPLRLRSANVTIERPGFVFNPTNCAEQHIEATILGAQGNVANVSAPFAVSGCAGLHFGPTFTVSTSGRTSKADGASLDAKVVFPAGAQSNIRTVKVDLPKALPSRLTTLQKACTAAQFEANPAGCPAASVIGVAKAITPILPVPLTGPVYFVSHGGEAFPSLIVVLEGYGVRVDLTAATFISKAGITSSTFRTIPDVPVNSFELYLPEGKHSALAANGNLCTQKLSMPTLFTAQDGSQFKQSTKIAVTGCAKAKKAAKKKKPKQASKSKRRGK